LRRLRRSEKKLQPQEIRSRKFTKKFWGYNPKEVDAFLIEVANAYQKLLEEVENLKSKAPKYKAEELTEEVHIKIREILKRKAEVEEEIKKQKMEIEVEIENLRLIRKKMIDKLRLVVFDIVRVAEEIKVDILKNGNTRR
jgi:cell division initiation protein